MDLAAGEAGDLFVTRSRVPYELCWDSPREEELDSILIHVPLERYLAALEAAWPGEAERFEVVDFFGRDEVLANVCFACAELLEQRTPGTSRRVAVLSDFIAVTLVERYVEAAGGKPEQRGGLPIGQLRKVEDFVREQLAEDIAVEKMAELVDLSPFHFSRVFKQATGMSPLQFVTRERISRAQQMIRETPRNLIEIALDVGYSSPSHFAQVFRRVAGVTPTEFRSGL